MNAIEPFKTYPVACPKCEGDSIQIRWRPAYDGCKCGRPYCSERDPRPEHLENVCRRCAYGWNTFTALGLVAPRSAT